MACVLQTVLLTVFSIVMVKLWGVNGFGVASVVSIVGYVLMHLQTRRLTTFSYRRAFLVTLITVPSLFLPMLPPPIGLVLLVPWVGFLLQPLRSDVVNLSRTVLSSMRAKHL